MTDNTQMLEVEHCLTVRQLKELIKDWPEADHYGGESEVWMTTSRGMSSRVIRVIPLNATDILLESSAFDE